MATKNTCAKRVTPENAYEVWQYGQQLFYVLKKYQANDEAPYARWLCATTNPYNDKLSSGSDVYAAEVMRGIKLHSNPLAPVTTAP